MCFFALYITAESFIEGVQFFWRLDSLANNVLSFLFKFFPSFEVWLTNIVYSEVCTWCFETQILWNDYHREYSPNIFKILDDQKNYKKKYIVFHCKEIFRRLNINIIISIKSKNTLLTVVCGTTHSPGCRHS